MNYWVIKGNPRNRWDELLQPGQKWIWETGRVTGDWQKRDRLFFWESGSKLRLIGLGEFFNPDCGRNKKGKREFELKCLSKRLPVMPTIDELKRRRPLNGASFLKAGPAATVFPLSNTQGEFLVRLLASKNPEIPALQRWAKDLQTSRQDTNLFAASSQRGIKDFHDSDGKIRHVDFQKWRKKWPLGYFLSLKTKTRALLHLANCNHPGSFEWGVQRTKGRTIKHSLTKLRKVCSQSQVALLSWADQNNVVYRACKHCLPQGYTVKRFPLEHEPFLSTGELEVDSGHVEGKAVRVEVSRYERDPRNRRACIQYHGAICEVCGFESSKVYRGVIDGYIHVHHKKPASTGVRKINPIKDLVPVCPNCHAMLHTRVPPWTTADLKRRLL